MTKLRLVPIALFAVLMAACGQPGTDGGSATQLIAASADATTGSGSALMSMEMSMSGPQGDVTMDAEGAYDFANQRGTMTMTMDLGEGVPGMTGAQEIEMVFEGLVIYMKYPTLGEMMPDAKPWIRMDMQAMGEEAGVDFGAMMQSGSTDPSQMLDWLRGASGDVEVVGEEDVRGVPATHYKGTIDFNKVVDNAPADVKEALRSTMEMMKRSIGDNLTYPFEVWIDEQGRTVRMAQSFDYEEGASAGNSMSMTMDFYDFGTEVDIEIPPASETTDFQELMGQMGAGATP